MPQRPAPRPTGYPFYPTALPLSTTSRRVPPRPILQNPAMPSTSPYSIPGFRPAPVYRMPAQRVTSRKSHANAIIAIVLVAAFVVLAVAAVAAKNRQIKEHEAITKQSKIVYDHAIQVAERTVISSMSILRLQVILMCCPTCIFSLPSSMSYRTVRYLSHAEPQTPSSQVTAMRA